MRFLLIIICVLVGVTLHAQNIALAKNYFDQGEFEKAISIYQKAYEKNPKNVRILTEYTAALQAVKDYATVETILLKQLETINNHPQFMVSLGLNYQYQNHSEKAEEYFEKAIAVIDKNPNFAYSIGREFQLNGLLDEAIQVYEKALEKNDSNTFYIELANIYGEKGELEKMFERFIDVIEKDEKYAYQVKIFFSDYITEDKDSEANALLRKALLTRSQKSPKVFYNEMLSWLYLNQKEYLKAFTQEKAIYLRLEHQDINQMYETGALAREDGKNDEAIQIFSQMVDIIEIPNKKIYPLVNLLELEVEQSNPKNFDEVEEAFQKAYSYFPNDINFVSQIDFEYAKFLAFKKNEKDKAITQLQEIYDHPQNSAFFKAEVKLVMADIYLQQEKYNQALLGYSQVQRMEANSELAQEATYKIAKTSFYTGDFDWAKTQLKILKKATSKLIANDALHLNVLISTNTGEDSLQTALKKYAKADLLEFQQNYDEALTVLEDLLTHHKGDPVEDDAFYKKAKILEQQEKYEEAILAYQQIKSVTQNSIYLDDVYFYIAKIYENHLNQPEVAKDNYERIIFDHQDSIYFTEAQKKYRLLRGDNLQ